MTLKQRQRITAWLEYIGEGDPEVISEILEKCRNEPVALEYFLWRSDETEPTKSKATEVGY